MGNEAVVRVELDSEPGTYGGLTDLQAADYMNDPANDNIDVDFISNDALHKATNEDELAALTDAEARHYDRLLLLEQVSIGPNSTGRGVIARLFDAASTTRAAVVALASQPASRSQIIGAGRVREGDVTRARAL